MSTFTDNFNQADDVVGSEDIQNTQDIGGKQIFINQTIGNPIRITNV